VPIIYKYPTLHLICPIKKIYNPAKMEIWSCVKIYSGVQMVFCPGVKIYSGGKEFFWRYVKIYSGIKEFFCWHVKIYIGTQEQYWRGFIIFCMEIHQFSSKRIIFDTL
jgi:hypothetical protein